MNYTPFLAIWIFMGGRDLSKETEKKSKVVTYLDLLSRIINVLESRI